METKHEIFNYTYSAKEQEEIRAIRSKYAPSTKEEATMEQLRRLDASATKGATVVSLTVGIVGTMLLGVGMCCVTVTGWERFFILGIIVGIVGIVIIFLAYPIYKKIVKHKRERLAPEIMRLTDELMK